MARTIFAISMYSLSAVLIATCSSSGASSSSDKLFVFFEYFVGSVSSCVLNMVRYRMVMAMAPTMIMVCSVLRDVYSRGVASRSNLGVDPSTNDITVVIRSSSAKWLIWCFGLWLRVCVPGLPRSARRVVADRASYCLSCSGSLNDFSCFRCILLVLRRGSFLSFFRRFCGSRYISRCRHK